MVHEPPNPKGLPEGGGGGGALEGEGAGTEVSRAAAAAVAGGWRAVAGAVLAVAKRLGGDGGRIEAVAAEFTANSFPFQRRSGGGGGGEVRSRCRGPGCVPTRP